jgi:alpha-D-xyloside xylohydrolase
MFVRAGSILPLGPEMQYVGERSWDHLEIRVYPGADGAFVLYEDEGDNYNYERGACSTITFKWNDNTRQLTIGTRKGDFPGMLKSRRFTVVLPDGRQQEVEYNGSERVISLK